MMMSHGILVCPGMMTCDGLSGNDDSHGAMTWGDAACMVGCQDIATCGGVSCLDDASLHDDM